MLLTKVEIQVYCTNPRDPLLSNDPDIGNISTVIRNAVSEALEDKIQREVDKAFDYRFGVRIYVT